MKTPHNPSPVAVAFMAIIAAAFFFAGYSVRTTQTAIAATPTTQPSFGHDGNPSGHYLVPPKVSAQATTDVMKCLKLLASMPLAIRYVTALPGHTPHSPIPRCKGGAQCAEFTWKYMELSTTGPSPSYLQGGPENVDVYGTLSLH